MAGPTRSSAASPSGRSGLAAVGVLLLLQSRRTCHSLILSRQTVSMIDPRGWNREREKPKKKNLPFDPVNLSTLEPFSIHSFTPSSPSLLRQVSPPPPSPLSPHAPACCTFALSISSQVPETRRGRESNCIPPIIIIIIIIIFFSVLLYPLVLSPSSISFLGRALFLFIHPPPSTTNTNSPSSWSPSHHMTTLARPAFGCPSGAYSPSSHKR